MSLKLHLGVIDLPYVDKPTKKGTGVTTGDVAEFLEADYGVMEHFFKAHEKDIAAVMESGLAGSLENMLTGGPTGADPFGTATSAIKKMFDDFILNKEMEKLGVPGVPTVAAQKGVNNRRKKRKGKPDRPSFYDTGLYLNSFVAWVT